MAHLKSGLICRLKVSQMIAGEAVPHDVRLPLQACFLEYPAQAFGLVGRGQVPAKGKPLLEVVREAHQTAFTGLGLCGSDLNVAVGDVLFLQALNLQGANTGKESYDKIGDHSGVGFKCR